MRVRDVAILGAGHAGVQLACSLRESSPSRTITLIDTHAGDPYQRPQLSKEFMTDEGQPSPLGLRTREALAALSIDFRDRTTAVALDTARRRVHVDDGAAVSYADLVLATGARNRALPIAGVELEGVCGLRTLEDAHAIRKRLATAGRVVVVGAGFIGLELAAAALGRGLPVTVVDVADRPMSRVLSRPMSHFFCSAHAQDGMEFRFGVGVEFFEGDDCRVSAVVCSDGSRIPADLVIVGIGIQPNTGLAERAGIVVSDGVVVDACMRTSEPHVWAIGDCARFPHFRTGSLVRLESVQNATDQAKHLGSGLGAELAEYREVPWFWSSQGALKLQIAGLVFDPDEVVLRGNPEARRFSVFCFRENRLIGVESVNSVADHMAARRLLDRDLPLTSEQASDPTFDLKAYSRTKTEPD